MRGLQGVARQLAAAWRVASLAIAVGSLLPEELLAQSPATTGGAAVESRSAPSQVEPKAADHPSVIVVIGAVGSDEFREPFQLWADRWVKAGLRAGVGSVVIGGDSNAPGGGKMAGATGESDRARLQKELSLRAGEGGDPLWIVLIGHGTFDGKTARFGLRGEDITPADLRDWLEPIRRPVAVIDCSSASAPFLTELSAPQGERVVISATRSGSEFNFARFGDALSSAMGEAAADLDKDEQTSLLEAFLYASARTAEFYQSDARLQTEHALLDDNGDKLGTPAEFFEGLRAAKTAKSGAEPDGDLASRFILIPSSREEGLSSETRAMRDELERKLAQIRSQRGTLSEETYWRQVEAVVTEIAKLYAGQK